MSHRCNTSVYEIMDWKLSSWFYDSMFKTCRPVYSDMGMHICAENRDLPKTREECENLCGKLRTVCDLYVWEVGGKDAGSIKQLLIQSIHLLNRLEFEISPRKISYIPTHLLTGWLPRPYCHIWLKCSSCDTYFMGYTWLAIFVSMTHNIMNVV